MNGIMDTSHPATIAPGTLALRAFWVEVALAILAFAALVAIPTKGYQALGLLTVVLGVMAILLLCSCCFAIAAFIACMRHRHDPRVRLGRAWWAAGLHGAAVLAGAIVWCSNSLL